MALVVVIKLVWYQLARYGKWRREFISHKTAIERVYKIVAAV